MAAIAKINGTDLPPIKKIKPKRTLRADENETAGGKLRRDFQRIRRSWDIEFLRMSKADYDSLISLLDSVNWGPAELWFDEFGLESNTVKVLISPGNEDRVPSAVGGGPWDASSREFSITVTEQ